ncbi:hypothetical protein P8452_40677 [Trifolium repens]|nr:hypothetical protein P8452_40677 [Trifolium repens]
MWKVSIVNDACLRLSHILICNVPILKIDDDWLQFGIVYLRFTNLHLQSLKLLNNFGVCHISSEIFHTTGFRVDYRHI